MKISLNELRQMVTAALTEAKKKPKEKIKENEVRVDGHIADSKMDFSPPLGGLNTYRQQGQSNFGPYTGDIDSVLGAVNGVNLDNPLYGVRAEGVDRSSVWSAFAGPSRPVPTTLWESALHYYDFQMRGLGQVREEVLPEEKVDEKHVGFKKLKGQLAHRKGVKNPAALAASIGRKKYGAAGMAKKAAAGRRK